MGLVTRIARAPRLLEEALEVAAQVARNAPVSLRQAKRAIDGGFHLPLEEALDLEHRLYQDCLDTKDRRRGPPRVRGEAAARLHGRVTALERQTMTSDGKAGGAGTAAPQDAEHPDLRIERELARIERGGAEKYHREEPRAGQALRPRPAGCCSTPARSSRTARSRTRSIPSCPPTAS